MGLSERNVRNYCAAQRVKGAILKGKIWGIPEKAMKPERVNKRVNTSVELLPRLRVEKKARLHGVIYHRLQIDMAYNSNHIEGSRLTRDQTCYIFETNTIGTGETVEVDDVVEMANHFKCIDMIIDSAIHAFTEAFIKRLYAVLKSSTGDSRLDWFTVGDYKKGPNEVGGRATTTAPEDVVIEMKKLLAEYQALPEKLLVSLPV